MVGLSAKTAIAKKSEKVFFCRVCTVPDPEKPGERKFLAFRTNAELQRHLTTTVKHVGLRFGPCNVCQRKFVSQPALDSHKCSGKPPKKERKRPSQYAHDSTPLEDGGFPNVEYKRVRSEDRFPSTR